jgi:hypothetical protein
MSDPDPRLDFDPDREDYPWQTVVLGVDGIIYTKSIGKTDATWFSVWEHYFVYDIPLPAIVIYMPASERWRDD